MKVLGLVASPRKVGNSEILVKEMLGALPNDAEKEMIRLTDLRIEYCRACYACLPEDKDCVLTDDLNWLLARIKEADSLVIATPCYFLGGHTTLKIISDRLISVLQNARDFAGKRCVLAVSYGVPGWDGYAREAAISFAGFLHLDVRGVLTIQAANPGEVAKPEILRQAHDLARCLLTGERYAGTADRQYCPYCQSTLLQLTTDGRVRCALCGATGRLPGSDGSCQVAFDKVTTPRFSEDGLTEHGRLLMQIKDSYLEQRQSLSRVRKPYREQDWFINKESSGP